MSPRMNEPREASHPSVPPSATEKTAYPSEDGGSWDARNVGCIRLRTPGASFVTDATCWRGRSTFFTALFSKAWHGTEGDSSFFVDCESNVFAHILRYLRTAVLPLFYDNANGHDFAQYHALLGEAEYFGIDRLCEWLRKRSYLQAVQVHYVAATASDLAKYSQSDPDGRPFLKNDPRFLEVSTTGQMKVDILPVAKQHNVVLCPAGKHGLSEPGYCRSCSDAGINGGWRAEDTLRWSVVRQGIVFDHDFCVNAFPEDLGNDATHD